MGFRGSCLLTTTQIEAGSVVDWFINDVAVDESILFTEGNKIEVTRVSLRARVRNCLGFGPIYEV